VWLLIRTGAPLASESAGSKYDGVVCPETQDNLDGAAVVPANLDRRKLHAPVPHERNAQTF
jgi:hypothetical protein